ncbi:ribonuclease Z [Halorubrum sp. E3]|uniref:Ribonuclease Z n=1 Tax=Halorubrum persicum TaxID=1383844 RepID=A0A2G1WHD1_9EURY|nr:ribonuclease Z [Halorubrum persicum]OYR80422.1 ribonuclease Z [Halorubrum sp. E3]PHQ38408.1 ribonuclease Z [Halorubrum persicum]
MSLRVTFLGTGGAVPTTERAPSALFVNREGDRLLFDCGEGTQRGMMQHGTGFGIDHLFVSHLHGDHVLGIPGLVQTLGFNDRAAPLTIHCPPGTAGDLHDLVHAVGHDPAFRIQIDEVAPGEVALDADGYEVRAFETAHRTKSQGYVLEEDDRPGRFDRPRAEELGVPVGPKFGRLHAGESVEAEDGSVVEPDQVVGPPRPGRKFVYTADTRPREETAAVAADADLLVHDATFSDAMADRARDTAHSTGREAGSIAERADAKRLALVHISSRYAADASPIRREAREAFSGECLLPDDGDLIEVPFPDADE